MDNELGELSVRIVGAENVGRSHTLYTVQCSAGVARWEVRKRFSDFVQLHTTLQTRQKVTAALPPKRMFGKMTDAVIKLRQEGLEEYLHAVLRDLESEQEYLHAVLRDLESEQVASPDLPAGLFHVEEYLHAVLRDLESEQVRMLYTFLQTPASLMGGLVRMLYTFLQLPASLMGGLAAGHDLSLQPDNGLAPPTFLQLSASLYGGLAAGPSPSSPTTSANQSGAELEGHLGAEELGGEQQIGEDASFLSLRHLGAEELGGEQQIGEDASFREIVDNVSDLMIDVFQTPLPVSSSELKARRNQYRAMLETCEFPLENDEDLAAHLLRIIGPVAAPEPHD
ncbi:hypothetical protein T484DRAFT_1790778, partial [Baffinella frigidus]